MTKKKSKSPKKHPLEREKPEPAKRPATEPVRSTRMGFQVAGTPEVAPPRPRNKKTGP